MILHTTQKLQGAPADIFRFFSDARNLENITPSWLRFRILDEGELEMRRGTFINYALWLGPIPLRWRSRIVVWEPGRRFIDVQERGPYRRWIHEHRFVESDNGVEVHDHVDYAVPGPSWVERWFVRPQLRLIFSYRQRALAKIFAESAPSTIQISETDLERTGRTLRQGGVA